MSEIRRQKLREYQRRRRAANLEKIQEKERVAARLRREADPEKYLEYQRQWRADPERAEADRQRCRAYREGLKARVLAHYGTSCACCGSAEGLTIDHIDGAGREHREELYGRSDRGGQHFYLWLIKRDFPEGYQTLCRPCNASKARAERCRMNHAGDPAKAS